MTPPVALPDPPVALPDPPAAASVPPPVARPVTFPAFDREEVLRWIADDVNPADAATLRDLLDRADTGDQPAAADLADRFSAPLSFGTAGLRGPLRAGPNGMNRTVVRRAAAGLAAWLAAHREPTAYREPTAHREPTEAAEHPERSEPAGADPVVVVGYDARHGSRDFAHESAAILAAAGFAARLLPAALPTPVLAFAIQRLGAAAGVMVTASHNPREDNGYKVYGGDGAQIVPPADQEIEAAIRAVGPTGAIPRSENFERLDESIVADYVDAVARLVGPPAAPITVVHTALHGVGTGVVRRVFEQAGYGPLLSVAAQAEPDPDFPTVAFPNPEEPGAIDLALQRARAAQADLVVANDPDADRCAVAVQFPGVGWRMLTGDELGVLLADALLAKGVRGTYATTIVSSSMLQAMAAAHGVGFAETLTGFKWIVRAAVDVVYGYEEALGYAVAPDLVRDKDGVSAALRVAEIAAELKAGGSSLLQRLDELAAEHGRFATDQLSIRVEDPTLIADTMRRIRQAPPRTLLGAPVTVEDLLPDADVLRWRCPGGRVVMRPSGTEPKLKAYLEVVEPGGSADIAAGTLGRLRAEVAGLLAG